jgi:hypothetical protein
VTPFEEAFGHLVVPELRRQCRAQGFLVAVDMASFAEAYATVMDYARRRGVFALAENKITELQDFILTTLLKAVDEFDPWVQEQMAALDKTARQIAKEQDTWTGINSLDSTTSKVSE